MKDYYYSFDCGTFPRIKYIVMKRFGDNFWLYDHTMKFLGIHTYDYKTKTFSNCFDPLDIPDSE